MNLEPLFNTAPRRVHRKRKDASPSAPPPPALVLTSASFDDFVETLTLVFDRAVSIADYDGAQISVNAGVDTGWLYSGGAASLSDAVTVLIVLQQDDSAAGGVTLTASGLSGIVAVDDGGVWAGATELEQPYFG
jgi:hypothetical protein